MPEWVTSEECGTVLDILIHRFRGLDHWLIKVEELVDGNMINGYKYYKVGARRRIRYIQMKDIVGSIGIWKQDNDLIVISK